MMPHGALKSACDAMNQLAVEALTACPAAGSHESQQRKARIEEADTSAASDD